MHENEKMQVGELNDHFIEEAHAIVCSDLLGHNVSVIDEADEVNVVQSNNLYSASWFTNPNVEADSDKYNSSEQKDH